MIKRAILFDLDDTLVCSMQIKMLQHKEAAKRFYNVEIDDNKLKNHWGKPTKELVQILYGSIEPPEKLVKIFHSLDADFPKEAIPKAPYVVGQLAHNGVTMGIVSNARKHGVRDDLVKLNFALEHFHFIHTFEDTGVYKPDPGVFNKALKALGSLDIDHIVYVGDNLNDFEAARRAGLDFIGVTTGLVTVESFEAAGAERIIQTLEELLPLYAFESNSDDKRI
jgi:HAD superfamily hydrolase (TIGR01509 family)